MKKIYFLFVLCLGMMQAFSQTLFTYGPYSVTKAEFLKAYNKNKTPVADKEKALREYLDLYSRFKLKVKSAEIQKLDTIQQLQFDLQNFRSQVEEGYMNDEKGVNVLVDEALLRSQKDIHLLHFYVPINNKMSPADTSKIYKAMKELSEELKKGETGYPEIVKEISEKYIEVKGKDVGYITAFSLPYDIENLVYALHPGEISRLYRTKSALHIFKNADERKSAGKWKVAQILISIPPDVSGVDLKALEHRADSVYELLINGADFAETAKQFSEDKLTYMNGGELPEFGTGKYELPFETNVFELKNNGDITKPIFTGYGYHIVKRIDHRDAPSDNKDEVAVAAIKQQVLQDTRIDAAKAMFLKEVKIKTGFKRNPLVKDADLFRYADSVAAAGGIEYFPINNKTVFSFAKLSVRGIDWLNFVKDYKLNRDVYKGENNTELFDKYIETATLEYYRRHLEEYNADFKNQLQEFKEGNMLFEIMERNVWSKASGDSVGLQKYYKEHFAKYLWAESADILLFNCSDEKTATQAANDVQKGKEWKLIGEESDGKIQTDSGRYELGQIQFPAGTAVAEGLITKPLTNGGDNTSSFVKVLKIFPAKQQRTFAEARGMVINDYQGFLEEKWMNELKTKYPVKVNETVFKSLLQ
ncbi:MAG: peptidylprolyl isomerase [Ferruginibacter sp.]